MLFGLYSFCNDCRLTRFFIAFIERANRCRRRLEEFDWSWSQKLNFDWHGRLRSCLPWSASATEWRVVQARRRAMQSQLSPLEAAAGLTAKAERLEELGKELSCRVRLRLAAFGIEVVGLFIIGGLSINLSSSSSSRTSWCVETLNIRHQQSSLKFGRLSADAGTVTHHSSKKI